MKRITIIGAGASGTLVAANLLRHQGEEHLEVNLVEKRQKIGRGVAFSTPEDVHLLNVPAAKMGAFPDDPEHFHRWLQEHGYDHGPAAFVPRHIFGSYLRDVLDSANDTSDPRSVLNIYDDDAVDLKVVSEGKAEVIFRSGESVISEAVVLAFGNFLPPDPTVPDLAFTASPAYFRDPWRSNVSEQIDKDAEVLIIGTGLSMVDMTMLLNKNGHRGAINAISTRGLLPAVHKLGFTYDSIADEVRPCSRITDIFKIVRSHIEMAEADSSDWRAVIDVLRPVTQEVWLSLPFSEKRSFMRHLSRYWNTARHRMAPEAASVIDEMLGTGQLRVLRGRLEQVSWEPERGFDVRYAVLGQARTIQASAVINCIGSEPRFDKIDSDLVQNLLVSGMIRCDALRFGLDAAPDGTLIDARGEPSRTLFTLGTALKGILWESTAIPEIRKQAFDLAQKLLAA